MFFIRTTFLDLVVVSAKVRPKAQQRCNEVVDQDLDHLSNREFDFIVVVAVRVNAVVATAPLLSIVMLVGNFNK